MFWVNGSVRGKAFNTFACLDVNVTRVFEMSKPHFLQNNEAPEFLMLQVGHFLCFRFFFSNVKVTVNRSFSTLKFSRGIHAISVLRFPDNLNRERTAKALNRKYLLSIVFAWSNALDSSSSSMTVSRFSLKALFLTRVKTMPPALTVDLVEIVRLTEKRC